MSTVDGPERTRRWRTWVPAPTLRLAGLAAIAVIATLVRPGLGAAVLVVAAVAAVVDAFASTSPLAVAIDRDLPSSVPLGESATVTWSLRNPATRALQVDIADELVPSLGAGTRRARVRVPAGGRATARTTIVPRRRGAFTPTTMTVRVAGPLGLVTRQARRRVPGRIDVHPSFRSRREAELRVTSSRILEVGIRSARGRGGGTEFDRLREYVPGDEVRRVDWSATARLGRPVVRTYRAERNQQVLVLLDTGRTMAGVVDGVPRLDHAMDAVMALTTVATHLGDRVGMLTFDAEVRGLVPPAGGKGQLRRLTDAMYALEPRLVEADHAAAFRSALARFRRRALLVLMTELADEAVLETLLPALPLVARDHELIVVSTRDPEVHRLERRPATTAGEAYTAASAAAAELRRDHTVGVLRRSGTTVVDAPPGEVATRLADAYLDLKATGRL